MAKCVELQEIRLKKIANKFSAKWQNGVEMSYKPAKWSLPPTRGG
jgi:hypothetical protein